MADESKLERLKRTIYSRNEKIVPKNTRTEIPSVENTVRTDWGEKPSFDLSLSESAKNNSFFSKFFFGSLIFFVLALGIALLIFFGGLNTVSSDNVDIMVTAPSSISSGEELDMGLSIENSNRTDLENTVLFIGYPQGVQLVGGDGKPVSRDKVDLGRIIKGSAKDHSLRVLIFGEKDAVKTFSLRLEYNVSGSNATFSKEKKFDVIIGSSPILLNVTYPQEINSGQDVILSIDVTSNSSVVLKNTLVKVEYPYGFTYKDSNIKPLRDNSVWNIGDLKNGDKKTLIVRGVLVGQNDEDRSFRISSGIASPSNQKDFDDALAVSQATVGIRKSFFDLSVTSANGNTGKIGQAIPISIHWQNTLPDKILNNHIETVISGNMFDRNTVSTSNGGFYRSLDNTVLWDKNTTSDLSAVLPGDDGQVSLSFSSITDLLQVRSLRDPHIDVRVTMTGDRSGPDAATISSTATVTIKFPSTVNFVARSYRFTGPFSNTGPIPPRADKETTYTISWLLTNTTNDLKNVSVSTVLPTGVEWKGSTSPSSESVTYNPESRKVTWNVGSVSAGAGFTNSPKEVFFQVGLTPNLTQVDSDPSLTSQSDFLATDVYTGTDITFSTSPVTTQFSDPSYRSGDNIVTK